MYPKRFRERIEQQGNFSSTRTGALTPDLNSRSFNQVYKSLAAAMARSKEEMRGEPAVSEMQTRDHHILIPPPRLDEAIQTRQKQLKLWLGEVAKQIFSVSFNYFSHKILDTQPTKIYSSECFIANLIELSKHNALSPQDLELVNTHLRKQILPYFLLRYPQSTNKQVNLKLNKEVSATDYLDANENNMFLKSKIKVQCRKSGLYFDVIMRFINYILQIPDKKLASEDYQTMFDDWNERMEKLFTSVYSRKWTETDLYTLYNDTEMSKEELQRRCQELDMAVESNFIKEVVELNMTGRKPPAEDKDYEDGVKEYTKYAINRKISENIPKFSTQEIIHGNIRIRSPAILRVIIKWCTELEEKFQNDYFVEKNESFVMMNGEKAEMSDEIRDKLNEFARLEWAEIKKFLADIEKDIFQKQSELSFANLMYYSSQRLPELEESIIKFANRNGEDVNHYAVIYLNRLIHGLMTVSRRIYKHYLDGWAQWPYPPMFISFTISDLLRCKCFSKEKEIIRIYKELEIMSEICPEVLRIVKVKNRLNRGTKDILLNVLFHKQALCEIQLAIKVDLSQFSLWSDKFNHYIYQLQRSTYGPVTQMCSIWSSYDERSSLLREQKIRVPEFEHTCPNNSYAAEIMPFSCSMCFAHYSQARYIYDHQKCDQCGKFWVCALCRIKTLSEEQLIKQLKNVHQIEITKRIPSGVQFPEYFVGFQLESIEVLGQKFRRFVIEQTVMFARFENGKLKVLRIKKNDKKALEGLFTKYIFFETKKVDEQLAKLKPQEVLDETSLAEISQSYKKKSESLRLTRKNITTELLLRINDPRAQANIQTLSFPENSIDNLKLVASKFSNVRILNLNKNNISSTEGLGLLTKLTDLYLGENKFKEIVEMQNLVDLKYVQLGDNPNAPQFKCDLSKLEKLESLTIVRSRLPSFPQQALSVANLKLLWLFQNCIKTLPASISSLTNLEYLHLEMNEIGALPIDIYELKKLSKLLLAYNQISELPEGILKLTSIEMISLQGNPLEKVPVLEVLTMTTMRVFSLDKGKEGLFQDKLVEFVLFK